MTNKIKTTIQNVYEKLREVLALYEKTDAYNTVPAGEKAQDISEYIGNILLEIRLKIYASFSEYPQINALLMQIVDETEYFVRCYERPGVVKRWQEINPKILFFDCAFDLMENSPELYQEICSGSSCLKLSCYPDRAMKNARKKYFQDAKKKYGGEDISDIEDKAFQDELLRTLELVFKNDFKVWIDRGNTANLKILNLILSIKRRFLERKEKRKEGNHKMHT